MLDKAKRRGCKPKFTKAQVQEMKMLNDQGYTMTSIGKKFGISQPAVSQNLKKLANGHFD